eukprot:6211866-Pleurochrysis_carterae.AAC.5
MRQAESNGRRNKKGVSHMDGRLTNWSGRCVCNAWRHRLCCLRYARDEVVWRLQQKLQAKRDVHVLERMLHGGKAYSEPSKCWRAPPICLCLSVCSMP